MLLLTVVLESTMLMIMILKLQFQVARYTPVLSDNNHSLSCTVRQQRGATVQFSRTFVLRCFLRVFLCFFGSVSLTTMTFSRLEVSKAAQGQPLVKNVSLLSGLVVSILLLLLSCSLLVLLTLRRRKRSRRESSLVNGNHALPPIYRLDTPLLLQRESLGRDCELGKIPLWARQR